MAVGPWEGSRINTGVDSRPLELFAASWAGICMANYGVPTTSSQTASGGKSYQHRRGLAPTRAICGILGRHLHGELRCSHNL
ncbi:hypothetical protein J6590_010649 [Homalodisca vitripennis]|nr:hypothetical protein J6590_010649 [Homalodisca vitripennis]